MNAEPVLTPVYEAWDAFQEVAHVRHIQTGGDYDQATTMADALVDEGAMDETHPRHELFMTIADLISAYDRRHYSATTVTGVELVRFLMKQHQLTQKDLPEIGTQSVVSEVLSGKRELTIGHIRQLAQRFATSPAAFF